MDIFILSLLKERHKLKITTLYNILKGKKTSSILTYGYFYNLLPYFGLFKDLNKHVFLTCLKNLQMEQRIIIKKDWIIAQDKLLEENVPKENWSFLNPLTFGGGIEEKWNLFLFALQVISQKRHHNKDYEPLIDSYLKQQQLKLWIQKNYLSFDENEILFYEEIRSILEKLEEKTANRLSKQFHGYEITGQVPQQIYEGVYPFNYLSFLDDLYAFFEAVFEGQVPIIHKLFLESPNSVEKTVQLIEKGLSFQEITKVRWELKESTLRDHIIEIAIKNPSSFPYSRFIQKESYEVAKKYRNFDYRQWNYQDFSKEKINFLSYRLLQICLQEDPDVLRR